VQKRNLSQVQGGVCIFLASFFFLSFGARQLWLDREFDGNVGRAKATIARLWTSGGGKGGTTYEASYTYAAQAGVMQEVDSQVGRATYLQMRVGQQVPIKFLLNDPTQSRIDWPVEEEYHWHTDGGITAFAFVVTLIGALVGWLGWRNVPTGR